MKYPFEAPSKPAPPPDELAYAANDVAARARDAEESYVLLVFINYTNSGR